MNGRTKRCCLTHRTVAKIFAINAHRRKYHRYCNARHQVIKMQVLAHTKSARTRPVMFPWHCLKESRRSRTSVTGCGHCNGVEIPAIDRCLNSGKTNIATQERPERCIVEQRSRRADDQATEDHSGHPVQAALEHSPAVGAKHLVAAKMTPDPLEFLHRDVVMPGPGGKNDGIDRASRRAADYGKRI